MLTKLPAFVHINSISNLELSYTPKFVRYLNDVMGHLHHFASITSATVCAPIYPTILLGVNEPNPYFPNLQSLQAALLSPIDDFYDEEEYESWWSDIHEGLASRDCLGMPVQRLLLKGDWFGSVQVDSRSEIEDLDRDAIITARSLVSEVIDKRTCTLPINTT